MPAASDDTEVAGEIVVSHDTLAETDTPTEAVNPTNMDFPTKMEASCHPATPTGADIITEEVVLMFAEETVESQNAPEASSTEPEAMSCSATVIDQSVTISQQGTGSQDFGKLDKPVRRKRNTTSQYSDELDKTVRQKLKSGSQDSRKLDKIVHKKEKTSSQDSRKLDTTLHPKHNTRFQNSRKLDKTIVQECKACSHHSGKLDKTVRLKREGSSQESDKLDKTERLKREGSSQESGKLDNTVRLKRKVSSQDSGKLDEALLRKLKKLSTLSDRAPEFIRSACHGGRMALHVQDLVTTAQAVDLMLAAGTDIITNNQINGILCSCVFVCQVSSEKDRLDLRRDSMGVWRDGKRFPKQPYIGSRKARDNEVGDCLVWRMSWTCKSYPKLRRTEIHRRRMNADGSVGEVISPVVIVYKFEGEPPPSIKIQPHGNSHSDLPFYPANASLLDDLRIAVESEPSLTPARIYNKEIVARPIGKAPTLGSIPRSVKQITDLRDKPKRRKLDPYDKLRLMMLADGSTDNKYIRRLTATEDNESICLYTDDMMDCISRNCGTNCVIKSPIHIETTHQLTTSFAIVCALRAVEFEGEPLMIGPILLTRRERFKDLNVLWEELLSSNSQLKDERLTFITDEDEDLIGSLKHCFNSCQLLRCISHLTDGVKKKMANISLPEWLMKAVICDMKEQVNFDVNDFEDLSAKIYERWSEASLDRDCVKQLDVFTQYYQQAVHPVLFGNIIERTELDGFGHKVFDSNPTESINAMIQGWCGKKRLEIDELCEAMKEGVLGQYEELKKGHLGLSRKYVLKKGQYSSNSVVKVASKRQPWSVTI